MAASSGLYKENDMRYSEQLIQQVWEKARASAEIDAAVWREDECGAWISRRCYGDSDADFGWKIVNVSPGGPDTLENLRPLNHRNAYDVAVQQAKCHVTADRTGLATFEHTFQPRNRDV
jgi:hypothetical protein